MQIVARHIALGSGLPGPAHRHDERPRGPCRLQAGGGVLHTGHSAGLDPQAPHPQQVTVRMGLAALNVVEGDDDRRLDPGPRRARARRRCALVTTPQGRRRSSSQATSSGAPGAGMTPSMSAHSRSR